MKCAATVVRGISADRSVAGSFTRRKTAALPFQIDPSSHCPQAPQVHRFLSLSVPHVPSPAHVVPQSRVLPQESLRTPQRRSLRNDVSAPVTIVETAPAMNDTRSAAMCAFPEEVELFADCSVLGARKLHFLGLGLPFSSWLSTDAASFFASVAVGFFAPLRTLDARDETLGPDCFLAIVPRYSGGSPAPHTIEWLRPRPKK